MKKIYTVTLNESEALPSDIASDMRIIAYFLCSNLDGYETNDGKPIMYSDGIKPNELLELTVGGHTYYHFTSDSPKIQNKLLYEPFVISDNSFGFTVIDDESVDFQSIVNELNKVLLSLEKSDGFIHYNFLVEEIIFDDTYEDRETVIKRMVFNQHENINPVPTNKKKTLTRIPLIGILGR